MRLAFALYKYFPFGGLARDFVRIANICHQKGHSVDVYVMEWNGELNPNYNVHLLPCENWSNHGKVASFHRQLNEKLLAEDYDVVIGFNKIPGVDIYYAADPCYIDRFEKITFAQTLNPRFRFYAGAEEAVFGPNSKTICLMISDKQTVLFKKHYGISDDRLVMLPPGIDINRRRPDNAGEIRNKLRAKYQFNEQDSLVLMVGSGFKTKGVDRALAALAALPKTLRATTHLLVLGEDNLKRYQQLAAKKGVKANTHFMGGRGDVADFLLACDLLLHPARKDNTGTVILEAMVAGLPMLVTEVCGYAKHVLESKAGEVLMSPFSQQSLNEKLPEMLVADKKMWIKSALDYADSEDLYSMPEKAVDAIERIGEELSHAD